MAKKIYEVVIAFGSREEQHIDFETYGEAYTYCKDLNFEWMDENCFLWDLKIREVEEQEETNPFEEWLFGGKKRSALELIVRCDG